MFELEPFYEEENNDNVELVEVSEENKDKDNINSKKIEEDLIDVKISKRKKWLKEMSIY